MAKTKPTVRHECHTFFISASFFSLFWWAIMGAVICSAISPIIATVINTPLAIALAPTFSLAKFVMCPT